MHKTVWKPRKEIEHNFKEVKAVTILSCSVCANLSGTGGVTGIKVLKKILDELKVKVVKSEIVLTCCEENIMRQAIDRYQKAISRSDALVVLSCAGGVKSAFLANPAIRVIAPLNSVGSTPITQSDNPISRSICKSCGTCVIGYTGGICPTAECPSKTKYGPCKNAEDGRIKCFVLPDQDCVWVEIRKQGDLAALKQLELLHQELKKADQAGALDLITSPPKSRRPVLFRIRNTLGWFGARLQSIEKLFALFRSY
jgi:hypothetical protein